MKKINFLNNKDDWFLAITCGFFVSLLISWIPWIAFMLIDSIIFILPNLSWKFVTAITWIIISLYLLKKDNEIILN